MEIALQGESRGIHYEGWEKQFIQCIFEEGEVNGRNERYEFRCDAKYECCGRVCCTPQAEIIPLWLMFLFIALALLLLLAILGTIAYLCAKRRKEKPKKLKDTSGDHSNVAYASLSKDGKSSGSGAAAGDRALLVHDSENYSSPDYYRDGYRNDGYGRAGDGYGRGGGGEEGGYGGRDGYGRNGYGDQYGRYGPGGPGGYGWGRGGDDGGDGGSRHGVHETFESSYKEEIVYEKAASVDSRERL